MLRFHCTIFVRSTRVSAPNAFRFDHMRVPTFISFWFWFSSIALHKYSDSEGELTLSAGDYLLVWGSGEPQSGYFDAELLDGRRGLVPASYVTRLIGKSQNMFFFLDKKRENHTQPT